MAIYSLQRFFLFLSVLVTVDLNFSVEIIALYYPILLCVGHALMYQKEEAEEDRPAARSGGGGHADTSLHALAAADSSTAGLGVEVLRLRRALEACRLENEDLKAEVTRLQQENRRLVRLWRNAPPAATTLARPHDPTRHSFLFISFNEILLRDRFVEKFPF